MWHMEAVARERVIKFKDKWRWFHLSSNPNVRMEKLLDVANISNVDWDAYCAVNPLTLAEVTKHNVPMSHPNMSKLVKLDDTFDFKSTSSWDIFHLGENPSLTFRNVLDHPEIPWFAASISQNINIGFDQVEANLGWQWSWVILSTRPDVTFDVVKRLMGLPWNPFYISSNLNVDIVAILRDIESRNFWYWEAISSRTDLTMALVLGHMDAPWSWRAISANPAVYTLADVEMHPYLPWDWTEVSRTIHLPFYFVQRNIGYGWDWEHISLRVQHASYVLLNPDYPWNYRTMSYNYNFGQGDLVQFFENPYFNTNKFIWSCVSLNPNVTLNLVRRFMHLPWNWKRLSSNYGVKMADILKFPDLFDKWHWNRLSARAPMWAVLNSPGLPWRWKQVSANKNITMHLVEANMDKPWNWKSLSKNTNIKFEHVVKHLDKPWNWGLLSKNPSIFQVNVHDPDFVEHLGKIHASNVIKRQWHKSINDPDYEPAKKRLKIMFEDDDIKSCLNT